MKMNNIVKFLAAVIVVVLVVGFATATTNIVEMAPDGINTISKTVDDNGHVIAESTTLVHVPELYQPKTLVYRLEREIDTDNVYIVGQDMVKRRVCLIDPDEYAMMTGQLASVWKSINSTEDGRRKLHGKPEETRIDGTEKHTIYSDGFVHRESMEIRKTRTFDNKVGTNALNRVVTSRKPAGISDRQWAMRQKVLEAKKNRKVRTVTVEHDAATGKDQIKE